MGEKDILSGKAEKAETDDRQKFEYRFQDMKDGDKVVRLSDVMHAIGNSDLYPMPIYDNGTPDGIVQSKTLDAVMQAIGCVPVYNVKDRSCLVPYGKSAVNNLHVMKERTHG